MIYLDSSALLKLLMPTAVASFRVLDSSEPCRITLLVTPYTTIAYRSP